MWMKKKKKYFFFHQLDTYHFVFQENTVSSEEC